jgi:hypothetical protein
MKLVYAVLLNLLLVSIINGQHAPFRIFNTHNGLPQIQVTCLMQDPKGYIWIGTKAGLAQFNGDHFHHFLLNDHIYDIQCDSNGNLYLKTNTGIHFFNGKRMIQIKASGSINMLAFDHGCFVYNEHQLDYFKGDSLCISYTGSTLPDGGISSLAYHSADSTLFFCNQQKNTLNQLKSGIVQQISFAEENEAFFVSQLTPDHPIMIVRKQSHCRFFSLPSKRFLFSVETEHQKIKEIKISHLPVKQHLFSHYYDHFILDSTTNKANQVALDFIKGPYPVMLDKDAQLWAGSDNGLYQIWQEPFQVFPQSFMSDFWTLIEGKDHQLYGGAFKQGLYRINIPHQQKTEIYASGPYQGKETDYYYGASKDRSGNLYFPTHFGLVKYDYRKTKKLDTGISLITKYDSINNCIIFGQSNGLGFLSPDDSIHYMIDTTKTRITSHPTSLAFTDNRLIWIGSGNSLAVYNRHSQLLSSVKELYNEAPLGGIISMAKDKHSNIWMGGRKGLWLYEKKTNSFKKIQLSDYSGYITAIATPNEELLLLGTTRELMVVHLPSFYQKGIIRKKLYNFRNGLLAQEIAQNGFLQWNQHTLVPSTTYTTLIDVSKIKFNNEFFNVDITHLNKTPLTNQQKADGATILLPDTINDLEFSFESVGFGLPTKPLFQYRLSHMAPVWSDWQEQNYASFSNLPSGTYTFDVAVKPATSEEYNKRTATIQVIVDLPFYKEPHFYKYAFFVLLVLSMAIAYIARSRYGYKVKAVEHERKKRYLEIASLQANLNPHS